MTVERFNITGNNAGYLQVAVDGGSAVVQLIDADDPRNVHQWQVRDEDAQPPRPSIALAEAMDLTVRTLQAIRDEDYRGPRPLAAYLAVTALSKLEAAGVNIE